MICLYLVSRAREILTYHLRIDANRIVPAARRWRKAGKAAMYSVVPVTNNKGRCVSQITDGVSEDVREGKHFGLYSVEAVVMKNLSAPCSLLGASVNFACLLTLLALLCF